MSIPELNPELIPELNPELNPEFETELISQSIPELIQQIIYQELDAKLVEIEDQSDRHKNHTGRKQAPVGSGHYDLLVVSPQFENLNAIQCHRLIYSALAAQMQSQIHALSIRAISPSQWQKLNRIKPNVISENGIGENRIKAKE
jgi:BolA family transcriptional regulator, general stress-responsive regulator